MANCGCTDTTPCESQDCGCKFEVDASCVRYTSDDLSCIVTKQGDTLDTILKNINSEFCNLTQGNYITVSTELSGSNCASGGIKIIVRNINDDSVISTHYLCGVVQAPVIDDVVNFDQLTPTTVGVVFTPNTPAVVGLLYVSSIDTSSWIWNGTTYQTAPDSANTEWYLYGTTTDAGGNKLLAIKRTGAVYVTADSYFAGVRIGKGNSTVSGNTVVGTEALTVNTTGNYNTAIGKSTLRLNTTGSNNTALGLTALDANTTGGLNTAVGTEALYLNATSSSSTAVGYGSLKNNTVNGNTAVGAYAANLNTVGTSLTAVGYWSLRLNTTGSNNTAVGGAALATNTTASNNTAVGTSSQLSATTGSDNTALGYNSSNVNSVGTKNTAIGSGALQANTVSENTAVGYLSLGYNTSGTKNTSVGSEALKNNLTGLNNTAIGGSTLISNTTGENNTSVGYFALGYNIAGGKSTALGMYAGSYIADGIVFNDAPVNSVFIGAETKALTAADTNQVVIGYGAIGAGSNTATIGNVSFPITTSPYVAAVSQTKYLPITINGVTYKLLLAD